MGWSDFLKILWLVWLKTLGDRMNVSEKVISKDYSKNFMSQVFLETNFIET